ncbi:MAG: GNAT family N-acetyltransferase [Candidatus Dependentiae bacterium]
MKKLLLLSLLSLNAIAFIQSMVERDFLLTKGASHFNFYWPKKNYWTMGTKNKYGRRRSCDNPDAPRQEAENFCAEISKNLAHNPKEYSVQFMPIESDCNLVFAYTRDQESRISFEIGFIAYKNTAHEGVVEITHLAVNPSFWRNGIGSMLVNSITVDSAIPNIKKLVIAIEKANNRAACFLIKNGFRYTNEVYTQQNTEKLFTLEKNIQ